MLPREARRIDASNLEILRALVIPYRLLQCCTADLGPKNADMIDVESWMPGRGAAGNDGAPTGAWGGLKAAVGASGNRSS